MAEPKRPLHRQPSPGSRWSAHPRPVRELKASGCGRAGESPASPRSCGQSPLLTDSGTRRRAGCGPRSHRRPVPSTDCGFARPTTLGNLLEEQIMWASLPPAQWSLVEWGSFVPTLGSVDCRMFTTRTAPPFVFGISDFYVDGVSAAIPVAVAGDPLMRAKFAAYSAAVRVVKRITTPDYYTDLQERVYPTLIVPDKGLPFTPASGERWSYCCVPVQRQPGRFEQISEQGLYERTWELTVYAFVAELSSDPKISTANEALAKIEDDLFLAFDRDDTLEQTVTGVRPVSTDSDGAWPQEGQRYGELRMSFEVTQKVSAGIVGPTAAAA